MKYLLLAISLVLIGCGSSDDSSDSSAADEVHEAAGSVRETIHDALADAEAVEDVVLEAKDQLDEALEAVEETAND